MSIEDDFMNIMELSFSSSELERAEEFALTDPYATEAINPRRQELLDFFDAMLAGLTDMRVERDWGMVVQAVSEMLSPQLNVIPGESILVRSARSFLLSDLPEPLDEDAEIVGSYQSLLVHPWYDIPVNAFTGEENEIYEQYKVESGLHVCIGGAVLQWASDDERIILGEVQVPLNHGRPELYKVLR